MQKVAILIDNMYQVLEVWYPYLRLREAGMHPILVGVEKKEYYSKEQYPAMAEITVREAYAQEFAAVIVPGGYAPDILRRYQEVNNFVKNMHNQGKVVAAICHGGWVLISAGILKDKNVTGFFAITDDLINAGAKFIDQEVVVDGQLITSRKPEDLPAFCKKLIALLS
jgi:protease I